MFLQLLCYPKHDLQNNNGFVIFQAKISLKNGWPNLKSNLSKKDILRGYIYFLFIFVSRIKGDDFKILFKDKNQVHDKIAWGLGEG